MLHSALPPAEELTLLPLADIARGGMGMVQLCRATDGRLRGRALAVKRLNPALEEEPEFVNMFLDETWITATIASPHVVKVEAWGRDDDGLFLAVELVEGVSLSRLIKESKEKQEPFAERTVAYLASQVCAGLVAAHELRGENGAPLGLVHRDLTPGNILVGFDGIVKIADFGIAKAEERLTNTRIGMMKGKPAYMAPEQARGGGLDGRADLFALGVVIFELLTGRRPWLGNNDLETLVNVTTKEPPSLSELRKTSQVFQEIVDKCLKKNPNHRFGGASEVKAKIDGWRRERGFDADDQASLAAFVGRNTEMQQAWFREALGGQLSGGGVTFADLEARIDKARRGTGRSPSGPIAPNVISEAISQKQPNSHPASSGAVARPLATMPMQASQFQGLNGALSEPDDEAKTQYLASPAAALAAADAAMESSHGGFGSTVALTPEETAAMSRRFQAAGGPTSSPVISVQPLTPAFSPHLAATVLGDATPGLPRTVREPALAKRSRWWLVLLFLVLLAAGAAIYYFVVRPRLP